MRHSGRKLLNRIIHPVNNQRGGIHVLIFTLLGIMAIVVVYSISINWMMQTLSINKTKPLIDQATRAATLDIDPTEAAKGKIVWNSTAATNSFYTYLRLNLKLDTSNIPQTGSMLSQAPVIHSLELVTNPTYPFVVHRTLTLYPSTSNQTTRNVDVTIYGPSIIAIVEISQKLIGLGRSEPVVLSSVASVRFR